MKLTALDAVIPSSDEADTVLLETSRGTSPETVRQARSERTPSLRSDFRPSQRLSGENSRLNPLNGFIRLKFGLSFLVATAPRVWATLASTPTRTMTPSRGATTERTV